MSYYGPLTQTYGLPIAVTSDGAGGLILTSQLLGTQTVTASNLTDTETAALVARLVASEDPATNWINLQQHLLGDG